MLTRLYRSRTDDALWLAYSEWDNLVELAGARRELARSPLNRRLHSMLVSSSERAFEPFGPVRSIRGVIPSAAALLVSFEQGDPEDPQAALDFLTNEHGHVLHLLMREVASAKRLTCLAHFDNLEHAQAVLETLADRPSVREFQPVAEVFAV